MALEDEALAYLQGLAAPWIDLFKRVAALDLASPELKQDLQSERNIDRSLPGFGDFDPASRFAILPGDPASSLVYHALASPLVKPSGLGREGYPAVAQLELVENYILSLKPLTPSRIPNDAVIAVFAYEYRPAPATAHRRQADFVYSRMGCSRIGEDAAVWDGPNRCWLNIAPGSGRFAVMPARFSAFLAVPRHRSPDGISVLGSNQDGDDDRVFFLPIRKLFNGVGCIAGHELDVQFTEYHRREKLRRLFTETDLEKPPGLDQPPFLCDSEQAVPIVALERAGASLLVSSKPEPLVRLAHRPNGEIAYFKVPPRNDLPLVDFALNRNNGSPSTFMIITGGLLKAGLDALLHSDLRPRDAPEFVNMRHRLTGDPQNPLEDLADTLSERDYEPVLDEGGYKAALFEDSIADGCICASVAGLPDDKPNMAAFSVIGAPKFFPYADEVDIDDWVNEYPSHNRKDQFKKGGPTPLNLGRFPPNLTLHRPRTSKAAFTPDDETVVAIVGEPYVSLSGQTHAKLAKRDLRPEHRTTTFLSDGCSGVFAPGWDVTFSELDGTRFYSTFGLGSPFPEDVKLCASANAFWPAASPDAARTFNRGPTAIPMLDCELGYHPNNPRRPANVPQTFGWDGEQGPFIVDQAVNFASMVRADYVSHAFKDRRFSGERLKDVTSTELIARMDALRLCIQCLPENSTDVAHTKLWLVHAEKMVAPPAAAPQSGLCFRYELVVPIGKVAPTTEKNRLTQSWRRRYVCYVSDKGVSWATSEQDRFTYVTATEAA